MKKVEKCWCELGRSNPGSKGAFDELREEAKIVADAGEGPERLAQAAASFWEGPRGKKVVKCWSQLVKGEGRRGREIGGRMGGL